MLHRIARLAVHYPRRILLVAAAVFVLAGLFGASVAGHLKSGGFQDSSAPSTRADKVLAQQFRTGAINLVVQVESADGIDSPGARTAGQSVVQRLGQVADVSQINSYWTTTGTAQAALKSADGRSGLVTALIAGDDDAATSIAKSIDKQIKRTPVPAGVTVTAGGGALINGAVGDHVKKDLAIAEAVTIPLTTLVLFWVFGSLVASLLPLVTGLFAIVGTLAVLRIIAALTDVSIFAMNLTTALGLALAIDYSLLLVNRYREEVRAGRDRRDAIEHTVQTAGRTVLFSALTVALSLAAMLVFPLYFLTSFAYAGIAVVALAATAAIIVVPALLALFGERVDKLDLRKPVRRLFGRPAPKAVPVEQSFWYRIAGVVMRRAVPIGLAVIAFLLVLGAPFLGVRFGSPDDRVLPASAQVRQVGDEIRTQFDGSAGGAITVVLPQRGTVTDAQLGEYATALSARDHVTGVVAATGTYAGGRLVGPAPAGLTMADEQAAYLTVYNDADPFTSAGSHVLNEVRDTAAPAPVQLTGPAARNADSLDALGARLPLALGLIAVATFIVLFMFTGSLLMPLKAIVLNALSLTATFGAMVWVFQDGHLLGALFGSTSTGYLVATMPILMFCLSFGMSMDYEVFLLSRIREEWLASARTHDDNTRAVQLGLARTGRIVTAAAVLMAIVFAGMTTSKVSFMQMFGLGLTLAVLMDATLIRGLLVPAFMKVAGRANWWAPAPLARWHARRGWSEGPSAPPVPLADRAMVETS
jgi:RND superfamily putative drug exporter